VPETKGAEIPDADTDFFQQSIERKQKGGAAVLGGTDERGKAAPAPDTGELGTAPGGGRL